MNKERVKIELTEYELQAIVYDDSEDFEVIKSKITGTFRHGNENTAIIKRLADGKFFKVHYRDSVKDECDFVDMNSTDTYVEVFPIEKTITDYE